MFLWQLSWRIPGLEKGTTVLTNDIPLRYYSDNSLTATAELDVRAGEPQPADGLHDLLPNGPCRAGAVDPRSRAADPPGLPRRLVRRLDLAAAGVVLLATRVCARAGCRARQFDAQSAGEPFGVGATVATRSHPGRI